MTTIPINQIAPFSVALSDKAENQLIELAKLHTNAQTPILVCETGSTDMPYMVLHGILRLAIAKDHGIKEVECLIVEGLCVIDNDNQITITNLGPIRS